MLIVIGIVGAVSLLILAAVHFDNPDKYDAWGNRR